MGKTRNQTHSELEHLRGEIKKLKSENRKLKREIRDQEKYASLNAEAPEEEIEEVNFIKRCGECRKGNLVETDLGKFIFIKCDICEFKQRKKTP